MLLTKIVCSDPECIEEIEVAVERLEELDGFVCECGYGFVLVAVSEIRDPAGSVVSLPAARRPAERRAA